MNLTLTAAKLSSRTDTAPYNIDINQSTLEILSIILEFRIATPIQIARFISQKDYSRYIYTKLRRMWQAGYLESFKPFSVSMSGGQLYYMLSKLGLKLLLNKGLCELENLNNYPKAKNIIKWASLPHEAQVVELASLESLNKSADLDISFKGELSSQSEDFKDDKRVEGLTPDYTAIYLKNGSSYIIHTEFERTRKTHKALLHKLNRYGYFLNPELSDKRFIRFIFQTQGMEAAFWLNFIFNKPSLQKLKIITTNLTLLSESKRFLEPIYASKGQIRLSKNPKLIVSIIQRAKLFS